MEKFSLGHTVLYSKGWYKRTNIWEDLQKTLEADGYIGCFNGDSPIQIKNRITHLIVCQFDRIPKSGHFGTLPDMIEGIKPYNCWRYGYYVKEYWDYEEVVVRYCLSYFSQLNKDNWKKTIPNKKVLPYDQDVNLKQVIDMFNYK